MKPANVLLDDDGNAYLSDFGIAEDLTDWRDNVTPEGLGYSAPEILRGDITPSADIFALGMIAQDLVNGRGDDPRGWRDRSCHGRRRRIDTGTPWMLARALRDARSHDHQHDHRGTSDSPEGATRKGLHSFVEADADDFFGRDALIDGLVTRLAEPPRVRASSPS